MSGSRTNARRWTSSGRGFVLLDFGGGTGASRDSLQRPRAARGVPLEHGRPEREETHARERPMRSSLVLVRPDGHVAWRGMAGAQRGDSRLMDTVRGALPGGARGGPTRETAGRAISHELARHPSNAEWPDTGPDLPQRGWNGPGIIRLPGTHNGMAARQASPRRFRGGVSLGRRGLGQRWAFPTSASSARRTCSTTSARSSARPGLPVLVDGDTGYGGAPQRHGHGSGTSSRPVPPPSRSRIRACRRNVAI